MGDRPKGLECGHVGICSPTDDPGILEQNVTAVIPHEDWIRLRFYCARNKIHMSRLLGHYLRPLLEEIRNCS